jgi:uncharacterized protein YvpB
MLTKRKLILGLIGAALLSFVLVYILQPGLFLRGWRKIQRYVYHTVTPQEKQEVKIMDIPLVAQTKNLNCEATTAYMIMKYYGKNITIDQIQESLPLDPNPHKGFRGNVDGPVWGFEDYGVYAEPIATVMTTLGVKAKAYKNISQDFLKQQVLAGKPAIIWVNISKPDPETRVEDINGEQVKLISGEHVAVVVGYDNGTWILHDPWKTTSEEGKPVAARLEVDDLDTIMWDDFDHMAVIVE